jgi:5-methylcytosine-specific restriction protein A
LLRSHEAESLVRSGWVTLIGVKKMVAVCCANCVARGGGQPVRFSGYLGPLGGVGVEPGDIRTPSDPAPSVHTRARFTILVSAKAWHPLWRGAPSEPRRRQPPPDPPSSAHTYDERPMIVKSCAVPSCPRYAVPRGRGRCARHRRTTTQRGYGAQWRRIRAEVLGPACEICGTARDLTVDHITPLSKGGTHDPRNLRTLCRSCHGRHCDQVGRTGRGEEVERPNPSRGRDPARSP